MSRTSFIASAPIFALVLMAATARTAPAQAPVSRFAGNYAGEMTAAIAGGGYHTGMCKLTISPSGKCIARVVNYTMGVSGWSTSTIDAEGNVTGQTTWDNGTGYYFRGTLQKHSDGSLRGTLVNYLDGDVLLASVHVNLPAR